MKIIKNTYPEHPHVPHAKPGEEVHWLLQRGSFLLIRDLDGKVVFSSAPVDSEGLLRSNGKEPTLKGIIAQVKKYGWILEVE